MHGLEATYWGVVDFVYLDQLDRDNQPFFDTYLMFYRPSFILLDPSGMEIQCWFGPVDAEELSAAIDVYLESANG